MNKVNSSKINSSSTVFNENTKTNKLKLFPQKQQQISRFQNARKGSNSLSRLNQDLVSSPSVDQSNQPSGHRTNGALQSRNSGVFVNNIIKQLEQTRKQLDLKDRQMQQLNLYVQEVIKENA
jgi:hypothetical protein